MQENNSSTPPTQTTPTTSAPGPEARALADTTPSVPPDSGRRRLSAVLGSRAVLAGLVAVVALTVAGSTLAYASMTTAVTLSVDGQQREVSATGDTVASVLDEEGLEVGARDIVAPALDQSIDEGTAITVRYARPFKVTVDGEEQTHWVTATSVSTALEEIGSRFGDSRLSTSRGMTIGRGGASLRVVTPKTLTLALADAKPVTRTVTALTVGDVLEQQDVTLEDRDTVTPRAGALVDDGDKIVYTDVRVTNQQVSDEAIEHGTVEREDSSSPEGETTVVREGRDGARDVTYRATFRNGELVSREEVRSSVVREPVDTIVAVGTKQPEPEPAAPADAPAPSSDYSTGSSVWDSLAACEAGGNWAINTGNGYYGGLQFNLGTWQGYGGSGLPSENSREEQIRIATMVRDASGGYGAWPACSSSLGLPQ